MKTDQKTEHSQDNTQISHKALHEQLSHISKHQLDTILNNTVSLQGSILFPSLHIKHIKDMGIGISGRNSALITPHKSQKLGPRQHPSVLVSPIKPYSIAQILSSIAVAKLTYDLSITELTMNDKTIDTHVYVRLCNTKCHFLKRF